jgi:hypothetical protein
MMQRLLCLMLVVLACGDETGLGAGHTPRVIDEPSSEELAYPIAAGDTFWYFFTKSFKEKGGTNDSGGMTTDERQVSGNLCVKVASVANEHAENHESTLTAGNRVVGNSAGDDIVFTDQNNPGTTAAQVDAFVAPLWLAAMTPATEGHGMRQAKTLVYKTRGQITPPAQSLQTLLFFDPRESLDRVWGGWQAAAEEVAAHRNFLMNFWTYFIERMGNIGESDDIKFSSKFIPGCSAHEDSLSCGQAACTWDFQREACLSIYGLSVTWRHEQSDGPDLIRGTVLHSIDLAYNENGSLRALQEFIATDPDPTREVKEALTECKIDTPCISGTVELRTAHWREAYCSF